MRARFDVLNAIGAVLLSAACQGHPAPVAPASPVRSDPCAVLPDSGSMPRRLVVAFTDSTSFKQTVARHFYEPLIRLSCNGEPLPALAQSWNTRDSGRTWTFTLRPSARFWDESDLSVFDIIASWSGYQAGDALIPWAGIRSARETGDHELTVSLDTPSSALPRLIADPALAITRSFVEGRRDYRLGTGPYRYVSQGADALQAEWWHAVAARRDLPDTLVFRSATGARVRDLLDGGVDVLITGDVAVRQYARARGGYRENALPWDRTYVLFVPSAADGESPSETPDSGFLEAIAREAVSGDARAVQNSAWHVQTCPSGPSDLRDPMRQPLRVVYPTDDETARELAHRLVTFSGVPGQGGGWLASVFHTPPGGRSFPFAAGLEPAAWRRAVARGDETGYVFAIPSRLAMRCRLPQRTAGSWIPLVETREYLISRAGLGGWYLDWDGTPHLRDTP